jgi:hypothetical protein
MLFQKELNVMINESAFKILINSSMFTYLSHDFFITVVAFVLLKFWPSTPLVYDGQGLSFTVFFICEIVFVETLSIGTYWMLFMRNK